jgi:hypothetical protein
MMTEQQQQLKNVIYQQQKWVFRHVLRGEKLSFIGFALALICAITLVIYTQQQTGKGWLDVLASTLLPMMIPIIPVLMLWYRNKKQYWLSALPAFMDVFVIYPEDGTFRTIGLLEAIPIEQNADIRQQAQTLLKVINDGKNVKQLELFIRTDNFDSYGETVFSNAELLPDQLFRVFTVKLKVNQIQEQDKVNEQPNLKLITIAPERYWYWCPILPRYHQDEVDGDNGATLLKEKAVTKIYPWTDEK